MRSPEAASKGGTQEHAGLEPLSALRPGEQGVVVALRGGRDFRDVMVGMGLRPGAPVTLVSKGWRGGSIVAAVGESRVALGRGMAEKVWLRRMR